MSKRLGTYLLPAVLLLAALLPGRVCAQLDARSLMRAQQRGENTNLYGVPNPAPEDEEGQAQQPVDSTKEKRIKKPLESYFFSDSIRALPNFKWNVSQDYNRVRIEPLDTTLTAWRIDYPFYRNGVGDAPMARSARDRFRSTISSGPSGRISVSPPRSTPIFTTCGTRRSTTVNVPSCK